jgi:L-arabinose isomerase
VQTADGRLKLLAAEAVSEPGPILEIGNTNSRYRFPMGAKAFLNAWSTEGPAHHCAIGIGHITTKLRKLAQLLGMECTVISYMEGR